VEKGEFIGDAKGWATAAAGTCVLSRWSNQFEGWVSDERGPVVQPPQRLNDPDHG
jgi:hypothetical protein